MFGVRGGEVFRRGDEGVGWGRWMTLPPSASSAPAPSSAAGQVAGGRPTSADFSPSRPPHFPIPLSPAGIVHSPLVPVPLN